MNRPRIWAVGLTGSGCVIWSCSREGNIVGHGSTPLSAYYDWKFKTERQYG